jgi:hypothetical protein
MDPIEQELIDKVNGVWADRHAWEYEPVSSAVVEDYLAGKTNRLGAMVERQHRIVEMHEKNLVAKFKGEHAGEDPNEEQRQTITRAARSNSLILVLEYSPSAAMAVAIRLRWWAELYAMLSAVFKHTDGPTPI